MKKILIFLLCFLSSQVFAQLQINIGVLKGMTSVPFVNMLDNPSCTITFYDSPSELVKDMQSGKIDVTNMGSVAAEKLIAKSNGNLTVTAITSTTDFSVVGKRQNLEFSMLPGKKVGIAGHELPEKLFLYLLKNNNIPLEKGDAGVEIVSYSTEAEAVNEYLTNKIQFVITSEPVTSFLCHKSSRNFISMDLQQQYSTLTGKDCNIPLTVLLFRTQVLNENSELVKAFYADLENSIQEAMLHPSKTAVKMRSAEPELTNPQLSSAIKSSKLCWKPVTGDFHLIVNQ